MRSGHTDDDNFDFDFDDWQSQKPFFSDIFFERLSFSCIFILLKRIFALLGCLDSQVMELFSRRRRTTGSAQQSNIYGMGREPCRVPALYTKWKFSHLFVIKIVMAENKWKRDRGWHIFKKKHLWNNALHLLHIFLVGVAIGKHNSFLLGKYILHLLLLKRSMAKGFHTLLWNISTYMQRPGPQVCALVTVWPEKNCQMSINVAQKWSHLKDDWFWQLYKNCLRT